ncbi:MAG TPA: M48 family metallopeptidase [Chloroflexota bacterium]|nr:M48 family metallopeptidase [Chloroflexota bacterium]
MATQANLSGDQIAEPPTLDPERQRLAKRYAAQKRALLVSEVILGVAYLSAWQIGLNLARAHLPSALAILAVFAALSVGFDVVSLPQSWLGYQLSRGYGLSTQAPRSWFADNLKGLAVMLVLGGIVVELAYVVLRTQPAWWWLIMTGIMLLFTVLLANLAPVLIVPLFYKFTPLEDEELVQRLLRLVERAGTHVRGVFTMHLSDKTTAANAAVMGWGNTRRIVVGDTLTSEFTHDETEAVLAHELGHHVHKDIWRGIAVESAVQFVGLWLTSVCLAFAVAHGWLPGLADGANMPALALLFGFFTASFTPLTNWRSRVAERNADAYAIRTAARPRAFVWSMIRLANQNLAEVDPPRWVEVLLYDHPAIQRRIELFDAEASAG